MSRSLVIWLALCVPGTLLGGTADDWQVKERGAHHKVLERTTLRTLADGAVSEEKRSVHVLGTGMHRLVDGNWVEARNVLEIFNGAAVARETSFPVIFSAGPEHF